MNLSFLNANWERNYPFIYTSEIQLQDSNNNVVPLDLIVGLRITCLFTDLPNIYINNIYTNNYNVCVSLAGSNGDIGYAKGTITDDNQSLTIYNYQGGTIGCIIIGNKESTSTKQSFNFSNTNGLIEPSTILILPAPAVSNISVKDVNYTGNVIIASNSLDINITGSTINLSVINPTLITSRGDRCASYLTCPNNTISGINSVQPDINGNIDIYAIAPLVITGLQLTTPTLALTDLCKLVNLPPANTTDTYGTLSTTNETEYSSWQQYTGD